MGNFYTNIVLSGADLDATVAALEKMKRRAYVSAEGKSVVVYDERCDTQDIKELERLATQLSRSMGAPALAFCNHDDDILWYALAQNGKIVDRYDSHPGYFDGVPDPSPTGGNATMLCAAFGASGQEKAVEEVLRKKSSQVGFEIDRHAQLLDLLGLPSTLAVLGYGYVSNGELTDNDQGATLRAVGGAELPAMRERAPEPSMPPRALDPEALRAMEDYRREVVARIAALAMNSIDVPDRYAKVLGKGRVNAFAALQRLKRYMTDHRFVDAGEGAVARADDVVTELLGQREFSIFAVERLLMERFKIPMLSAEDTAVLNNRSSELHARYMAALRSAIAELQRAV
jgi:hypothetical protein